MGMTAEMNTFKTAQEVKETSTLKKPYHRPAVQAFGKLHLLTQGTGSENGDGGQGMMPPPMGSDLGLKENIIRIDTHPLGIGLYLFDYKEKYRAQWGHGRQFGVIAQEVEAVIPEAVCMHPDGYKMVNYAMLGISHRIQ
jgi:hypothetical protein